MGLGKYVVGRTDYCISPAEFIPKISSVGGPKSVDGDKFRTLKPTHVLVCPEENTPDIIPLAEDCGAELVVVDPKTPQDNHQIFRKLGTVFECRNVADEHSKAFSIELGHAITCKQNTPEITALPLIWRDPWMTMGPQTYGAAMLASIGIHVPNTDKEKYPILHDLSMAANAVDCLILTTEPYSFTQGSIPDVQSLSKTKNVTLISGESLAWYGSYSIQALEELVAFKRKLLDMLGKTPM